MDDPGILCDERIRDQIKAVVDDLIRNVDEKTPPANLSEEEIQRGIAEYKYSKHYKLSRNLRITKAIYSWIVRNVEYTESLECLDNEEYHTQFFSRCSGNAFVKREGVCLGKALLFKLMTRIAGIPCEKLRGGNHAFDAVYVEKSNGEKGWTIIDPTWGRFDISVEDYTEDLDNLFDNILEELKSLYSDESSFTFNEEHEKEYFSRLKPLVEMKKQEYDKSKETQTITAEDIQTINNEYEAKGCCVLAKRILIVEEDGKCKIKINFDFQKDKLLRKPTKLTRQENFPAFYSKVTSLKQDNSTMVEGGKHSHRIEGIGNINFDRTEKGDLKIHNPFSKINLRITEGLVALGKKIIVEDGIKKLKLCGDVEIDISEDSHLEEIDTSDSSRYGFSNGILYEKSSGKIVGGFLKEFCFSLNDNSIKISFKENIEKLVLMQEKSNPNQKIDFGSEVKVLDLGLSSSIPFRIFLSSFKEGKKLVVIQEMSELNKKIVVGWGMKVNSLEIHGDAEIDISRIFSLEEVDISDSTRYDVKDEKLYDITDPKNFKEVRHRGFKVIKNQKEVCVQPTIGY